MIEIVEAAHGKDTSDHLDAGLGPDEFAPVDVAAATVIDRFNLTDVGAVEVLAHRCGDDLRYVEGLGWLAWSDTRWVEKDIRWLTAETFRELGARSFRETSGEIEVVPGVRADRHVVRRWASAMESASRLRGVVDLARAHPKLRAEADAFDRDPLLLNVANGTLDLRSGVLRAHRREDLLTHQLDDSYDPAARAPRWERFLTEVIVVLDGRGRVDQAKSRELRAWLRRAVGYSIFGSTREQCFFVCHGTGANGKSIFLGVLLAVLGTLGQTIPFSALLAAKDDKISNDVARLRGKRFVSAIEANAGRRLDEAKIKQLTGGDRIAARFLYHETFEFEPTFKIWLACNDRPEIQGTDHAIWRRVKCIDFPITVPKEQQDPDLKEKLLAESVGILAWAAEGARESHAHRLGTCESVEAATAAYREEEDTFAVFSDQCLVFGAKHEVTSAALHVEYAHWAERNDASPLSPKGLAQRLKRVADARGKKINGLEKVDGARGWKGVDLSVRVAANAKF
jgi:putative DNA primase/helicase